MALQVGVYTSHDTLCGSLFIAGRSIDLAGEKEVFNIFQLQVGFQLSGVEIVIFDSIGRPENLSVLKTLNLV